jgi:MurNAc alpha-1-phosphate uridylyltransferase
MRPLTDTCPKPLLEVGGRALIAWHLAALAAAGFREVVINHAHLGAMIERALGRGERWGLSIAYSREPRALETAGGIANAMSLLGEEPFLVVNGDIWCDFDFGRARTIAAQMQAGGLLAWCVLVDNPLHNPGGDFGVEHGRLSVDARPRRTFSGIGVYRARLFEAVAPGQSAPLAPLLRHAIAQRCAGAEYHAGRWVDVGTVERLAELDAQLRSEV